MNITKRFDPPENDWVGRCNHCRSEVTASLHEVTVTMTYCGEPISGSSTCPVCNVGTITLRNTTTASLADLSGKHAALATKPAP